MKGFILGPIFFCMVLWISLQSAWTSLWEEPIPEEEVEVTNLSYKTADFGTTSLQVIVRARVTNNSEMDLSDFTATVAIYDCASEETPVEYCFVLGRKEYSEGLEIPPGMTKDFVHSFIMPSTMATADNYERIEITFSEFEGT